MAHAGPACEFGRLVDATRALGAEVHFLQGDEVCIRVSNDPRNSLQIEDSVGAFPVMDVEAQHDQLITRSGARVQQECSGKDPWRGAEAA